MTLSCSSVQICFSISFHHIVILSCSSTAKLEPSFPSAWLCFPCHWHGEIPRQKREED